MRYSFTKAPALLALLVILVFPGLGSAASVNLDRGVVHMSLTKDDGQGRLININVIKADMKDTRVETRVVMAEAGLGHTQTLSSMARNNMATAGINGGFFSISKRAIPTDTFIFDGRIISKGMRDPAAFGLFNKQQAFIDTFTPYTFVTLAKNAAQFNIEAVNHETGVGIIMYTPDYGTETGTSGNAVEYTVKAENGKDIIQGVYSGNAPIPPDGYVISYQGTTGTLANLTKGEVISVDTYYPPGYENIQAMMGCGPLLVRNGVIQSPNLTFLQANLAQPQPRSAIGITADRHLLLVAVDGRNAGGSVGMRYDELAALLKELGARDAMALDGGGSTALYVGNQVVNVPSGGNERNIANAVLIISQIPVYLDGERLYFEVPPIIQEGRVLVPMRALFEKLGANVRWDDEKRTITANSGATTLELSPDNNRALVNGQEVLLDVQPVIREGRTLVPLRFVSTALGAEVLWDGIRETVAINT